MSWDVWVVAAKNPPPILARLPDERQDGLLGNLAAVRQRISSCFGDVDWSDPLEGYLEGDGVSLEFDLGDDEPCGGFMIRVRGAGEVEHLLVRLSEQSGWHLYDCTDGQLLELRDDADEGRTGHQSPREITAAVWRHVLLENAVLPLLLVALGWGFYISAAIFHFDIISFIKRRDPKPLHEMIPITFSVAIVFTIVGSAFGIFNTWRALRLAQYGAEVVARVTNLGSIGYYGQIRVYYEFSFDGQVVGKVMSCLREEAQEYRDGVKPLVVMCDPWRPRRSMLRTEVLPDSTPGTE